MDIIEKALKRQRDFFKTGKTKDVSFRLEQLKKLCRWLQNNEQAFYAALKADFGKCEFEVYTTELAPIIGGIKQYERRLRSWTKDKTVFKSVATMHMKSTIRLEPFGAMLIISPWNYPVLLTLSPLIGAMAAGNTVVLKLSRYVPNTAKLIKRIIEENFDSEYIAVFEGGKDINARILAQKYDYMFLSGGTKVGKIVMHAAAENLTPVTLELGGKSPCIVNETANIKKAAKSICWGKFMNAGQTCIAPDFVMVHAKVKPMLIEQLKKVLVQFYGDDPSKSPDFARIISDKHFTRLLGLIDQDKVIAGGQSDAKQRYIAPTILDNVTFDDDVMGEEIFGPVLPIIEYDDEADMIEMLRDRPTPLAMYIFSNDKRETKRYLKALPSGDVVINDTILQIVNPHLPFGGQGGSGIGHYHGKHSLDAFSHHRSVVYRNRLIDIPRYAPYERIIGLIKKLM
jgi:aldehyde dehydrogenase (NAD+)